MAGLIQNGAAQQAPDRQAVERIVTAAVKLIHDKAVHTEIIAMMKQIGDPTQALAQTTVMIMKQIYEKSGRSAPMNAMAAAAVDVLQLLMELGQAAGLFKADMPTFEAAVKATAELAQQPAAGGSLGQPAPMSAQQPAPMGAQPPNNAMPAPAQPAGGM